MYVQKGTYPERKETRKEKRKKVHMASTYSWLTFALKDCGITTSEIPGTTRFYRAANVHLDISYFRWSMILQNDINIINRLMGLDVQLVSCSSGHNTRINWKLFSKKKTHRTITRTTKTNRISNCTYRAEIWEHFPENPQVHQMIPKWLLTCPR